ncbi:hypothetical protein AWW69_07380 [Bacillus cereus]|nr:hypothetical protein AWW69_07380 [Bacillus cereus]
MQGAFLFCLSEIEWDLDTGVGFQLNISAIFQIYRTQLEIYQRLFEYIDVSTQLIDLPTILDKHAQPTYPPHQSPQITKQKSYRTYAIAFLLYICS